jgi:hypothetical protein
LVARRVIVVAITCLFFRPARAVGVLLMSNKTIGLTHVNQIGWMRTKIEYIRIKKIVETKKKKTTVEEEKIRYYTDPIQILSPEQLKQRSDYNQTLLKNFKNSNKSHVDHKVQASVVKNFLNSISEDQHHMLITWTYPKIFGKKYEEVLKDIFAIRSRIINLLFPNFKPKLNNRRDDCPRMYFFPERHSDGQYHIHLLMETIEPDLWAKCLDREAFRLRWHTILKKINSRIPIKQMVITQKMIDRWSEYKNHPYANKTFSQIESNYDEWKVARFICEYISHYNDRNNERWGLKRICNSPENNHSKVIESKAEIRSKCSYLNKDRYFIDKDDDFLRHIVPEYSDF